MAVAVVVFSIDKTRGNLLLKILESGALKAKLIKTVFDLERTVSKHAPSIIIFDSKYHFSKNYTIVGSLRSKLPKSAIIVLCEPYTEHIFTDMGIRADMCMADPLDPELILAKVREVYFIKNKLYLRFTTFLSILYNLFSGDTKNPYLSFVKKVLLIFALVASLTIGGAGGFILWSISDLPKVKLLEEYTPLESSRIFSTNGEFLAEVFIERRRFVPSYKIPEHVKKAFIAVEDVRFYKHFGVDFQRVVKAFIENMRAGTIVQGGSTITQQLAKMLFLKPEKSLSRKIKEIAIAFQIEGRYTKDEILSLYLNQAYFGSRTYGIEAASSTYFGKKTEELTIAEAALLAAIPKAPSTYSPFKEPQRSLSRRNTVIRLMYENGFISDNKYKESLAEPIPKHLESPSYKAPYFVEYIKGVLEQKYGDSLYTSGLKIYTTLDMNMQNTAEKAIENAIEAFAKRDIKGVQAALLAVEIKTGEIKAMVGGTDFWETQFNRATQAMRQPGSSFKPFVYLAAFRYGYKPSDTVEDREVTYFQKKGEPWTPHNYTRRYYGTVTLKSAIARSLNVATVSLANKVGMERVVESARLVGIKSVIRPRLPSALGASEVNLLELVSAYCAFSDGNLHEPISYTQIVNRYGLAVENITPVIKPVLDNSTLEKMHEVLSAVVTEGTAQSAKSLNRVVYGKTGTTDDYVDAWFIGFDDKYAVGVWVGRDDHTSIGEGEAGSKAALPIWIDFMKSVVR
ncbi:MAG: PBP1A family penicillin-binding protein [Nitrospirae bacterium]|nr:PBP1A family penicillin-binding protein [Nitrospirota bacterium]MBF0617844.1 PBP1A family penicillin-binding protein [Nitrospirota bacterium]